jgi:hypothetical protein
VLIIFTNFTIEDENFEYYCHDVCDAYHKYNPIAEYELHANSVIEVVEKVNV